MANLAPFLAVTLIGIASAVKPNVRTVEIGIVAERRTRPAAAIDAVTDVHHKRVAIGGHAQHPHRHLVTRVMWKISFVVHQAEHSCTAFRDQKRAIPETIVAAGTAHVLTQERTST